MKASLAAAFAATLLLAPNMGVAQTAKSDSFVTVQPADQWLVGQFIGQGVSNDAGEVIGDINDLLFDKSGKIVNVVIGVGGFLGIGEKNVAIPYSALAITADANGKRVVKAALPRARLPRDREDHLHARQGAGHRDGPEGARQSERAEGEGEPQDRGDARHGAKEVAAAYRVARNNRGGAG